MLKKYIGFFCAITFWGLPILGQNKYIRRDINLEYIRLISLIASHPKSSGEYVAETLWVHYYEDGVRVIKVFSGKDKHVYFTDYKLPLDTENTVKEFIKKAKWDQIVMDDDSFKNFKITEGDLKNRKYSYCLDRDQWIVYALINGNGIVVCSPDCNDSSDGLINKGMAIEKLLFK